MKDEVNARINDLFKSIEIHPEYSTDPVKITNYQWNQDLNDFTVVYYIHRKKYTFRYNEMNGERLNPLRQLEKEVHYIKRMNERGIGSKHYYPFTTIE